MEAQRVHSTADSAVSGLNVSQEARIKYRGPGIPPGQVLRADHIGEHRDMKELLQPQRDEEHRLYARLREGSDPHSAERREFFGTLWRQYEPFAPKGFPKKLQIEFHQRWWEMYLVVGMLHLDLEPICCRSDTGPDISLDIGGRQMFVEATAPTAGMQSDQVPQPVRNGVAVFPERECLLRLTQALTDKCKRLQDYIDQGIIPADACVVIALSASDLNQFGTLLDWDVPALLKVLAGAGPPVLPGDGSPSYPTRRNTLQRNSGRAVDAVLFESAAFSIISGVLYSPVDLWSATPKAPEDSLSLFVNPSANQPIPDPFLTRFVHWVEQRLPSGAREWHRIQRTGPPYS